MHNDVMYQGWGQTSPADHRECVMKTNSTYDDDQDFRDEEA